ncbi:hypothetical protein [Massilia violaceinigra]|uniref:hypothetical protein n=1 Tax=Massilia violaceinigra TaxID=2045208 RepID=UPI000C197947|nr:hypothetical protein [Massilia violaceinigra]
MAEITNTATIKVVLDADGVEVGLRKIDQGAAKTGAAIDALGKNTGVNNLGDGAEAAAGKFTGSTKTIINDIQRRTAAMELGKKGTVEYYAALADQKGINQAALKPYLDQLDAVTRKTALAAEAQRKLDDGTNFLQGLQAKADAIGKTASELTAMRAAELGVAEAAAPLIEQLRAAEEAAGDSGEAFSKTELALGALAAVAGAGAMFGSLILEVAEMADDLGDLSTTTGIAVDDLAGLKAAAGKAGSDLDGTAKAINKLSVNIAGNAAQYAKLGVSAKEPLEAFKQFADVFSSIQDPQLKAKLGAEALGESWQTAAPLLSEGSKKIGELVAQGKAAANMTEDLAEEAGEFNASLADLNGTVDGFKTKLVSDVLPSLNQVTRALKEAYEESGLLQTAWVGLGALGALAFTDEFSSATVKIKNLREELFRYQQDLELSTNTPYVGFIERLVLGKTPDSLKGKIAAAEAQIKQLEGLAKSPEKDAAAAAASAAASAQAKKEGEEAAKKASEFLKLDEENRRKSAAAAKAEMDAYRGLTGAINERINATGREIAGLEPLTESQKLQATLTDRIRNGELSLTAAHKESYEQLIKKLSANEAFLVSTKNVAKVHSEYAKFLKEQADALNKPVLDAKREADANEALVRNFGLTRAAIEELTVARLEDQLAQRSAAALTLDQIDALQAEIAERKRSVAALQNIDGREAAKKANDAMVADWEQTVAQYDDIFRTGFADMLNNGKDGWKSFTKSLVTTFKTSVADQIYKMFIKPLVVQVVGSMVGGGAGGAGGISAGSLVTMGQSIYSAFTNASSTGGGLANMGKALFSSFSGAAASSGAAGASAAGVGANAAGGASAAGAAGAGGIGASGAIPIVGWIAAGMALSNSLYKKGWDAQNGSISSTGPVAPFNAPMLHLNTGLQKLGMSNTLANMFSGASTVSRLFGRKNPEVKDFGIEGTFGASGFDGKTFQNILEKGGLFRSDKRYTKDGALDAAGDSTFDDTIKNLMTAVKGFGAQMGIEAAQIDTYTKAIKLTLTSDEAKNQELITGVFGDIGNDLAALLIPTIGALAAKGESASAALQRIAIDYAVIDAGLASIGESFGAVGVGSLAAREKLVELSGGIDNFSKGISFFSQNYQTEAERMTALGKTVDAAFASLEITVPTTRDEFKNLVLGLDLTTEKGAKTFAGLMSIQEAFATLNPALAASEEAVRSLKDIAAERAGLQGQVDQLTMTPAAYAEKQRLAERGNLDDSNRPLFDQLTGARAAAALAVVNKTYEDQIAGFVRATMSASEIRALETKGMDETTIKLYDLVAAYNASAVASGIAKEAADRLAATNKGYEDQILVFEKAGLSAAELRKLETKGMDESTVKLYDKLKALEAAKLAQDAADRAAAEAAAMRTRDAEEYARVQQRLADEAQRAAEQMRDAWQSVTDSIFDEVKRIRGLAAGDGASTLAGAQAEFAIKSAQAQAGNQDAAKLLPSISQKLIELAEANATSLLDLQRIRARTAASLDATGAILAAKFGLTLPSLAVGTNYLPADMVIQAHEGERVIPAADNRALMQMINRPAQADTSAAAQQQSRDEMSGLRAEVRAIALSNAELVRMGNRVNENDAVKVRVVV